MIIELKNVSKDYATITGDHVEALEHISFEISNGEMITVVGPSGCGKSTLLRLISGVEAPSKGIIERDGTQTSRTGFMFQDSTLMRWRTVYDNIRLPLEVLHERNFDRINELVKMLKLTGFENAYPTELSGGMQRRVAMARALVHQPRILLLDEPFTGVDEITREILQTEINSLIRQYAVTSVLVTHDIDEAVFLGDKVFVMSPRPGRIVHEIDVSLPKIREPALRTDSQFINYCSVIRDKLNLSHPT